MHKTIREYQTLIESEQMELLETTPGVHYKFRIGYRGEEKLIVASRSPSDPRAVMNFRGDLRRFKREVNTKGIDMRLQPA